MAARKVAALASLAVPNALSNKRDNKGEGDEPGGDDDVKSEIIRSLAHTIPDMTALSRIINDDLAGSTEIQSVPPLVLIGWCIYIMCTFWWELKDDPSRSFMYFAWVIVLYCSCVAAHFMRNRSRESSVVTRASAKFATHLKTRFNLYGSSDELRIGSIVAVLVGTGMIFNHFYEMNKSIIGWHVIVSVLFAFLMCYFYRNGKHYVLHEALIKEHEDVTKKLLQ
jgi:hypothetical protein